MTGEWRRGERERDREREREDRIMMGACTAGGVCRPCERERERDRDRWR